MFAYILLFHSCKHNNLLNFIILYKPSLRTHRDRYFLANIKINNCRKCVVIGTHIIKVYLNVFEIGHELGRYVWLFGDGQGDKGGEDGGGCIACGSLDIDVVL